MQREVVTDDFRGHFGKGVEVTSGDDFVAMARKRDESHLVVHSLHQPEISVDGDTATGIWLMQYRALRQKEGLLVEGAAHYFDEYRREPDGQWRISVVRLERLYEFETSVADMPSFRIVVNELAT